jgi:hypothetical protein
MCPHRALAEAAGAMKVIPLAVAGAFHTPLMPPAIDRLAAVLEHGNSQATDPGAVERDAQPRHTEDIRNLLVRQVVNPCSGKTRAPPAGRLRRRKCYESAGRVQPASSNASNAFPCDNIAACEEIRSDTGRRGIAGRKPQIMANQPNRRIQVDLSVKSRWNWRLARHRQGHRPRPGSRRR